MMFKNYFVVAIRNIIKGNGLSLINIIGLAIGIAACLLILHYVNFEKSYDRFYEDTDRIYRLRYERYDEKGNGARFASCCPPAADRIRDNFPEVEKIGRIFRYRATVSHQNKKFYEERIYFAESDFLAVLPFHFIEGDPLTGIQDINTAFISQSTARKYFGDENPIGETFSIDKKTEYKVTGIFADMPENSHLKCDFLLSYENVIALYGPERQNAWGHTGYFTYLRMRPDVNIAEFQEKLAAIVDEEFGEVLRAYNLTCQLPLQPLTDIHLTSHFMQEYEPNGNLESVNFLLIIAIFIIIIAWVNFINLTTARSLDRAKEVGLRKVVGARRQQLVAQFFLEILLTNIAALIFAFFIILISIPYFSDLTGMSTTNSIWSQDWLLPSLAVIFFAGILFSGFYPVIVLSSFHPAVALKGKSNFSGKGIGLRKALIIFQFIIALLLIGGTLTVHQQLNFMRHQDPGFQMDQIMVLKVPRVRDEQYQANSKGFKEALLRQSGIENLCQVSETPGRQILWDAGGIFRVGDDPGNAHNYQIVGVDYDFTSVFDLQFVAGRNFSQDHPSDTEGLLLNETALDWMGFPDAESAIGEQVDYWGNIYTILGVLKDYHQQSLKEDFEPHLYRLIPYGNGIRGNFAVKISSSDIAAKVKLIEATYEKFFPGNPTEYYFLDEYYNQQYQSDQQFGEVFGLFAGLAIFITAMGLLGLSAFNAIQRTKEIGIRKVLGASATQLLVLLTKDFFHLLLLAFLIALPLLYWGLHLWLNEFAYAMALNSGLFLLPLIIVSLTTLAAVSYQTIKSATGNPIEALRSE